VPRFQVRVDIQRLYGDIKALKRRKVLNIVTEPTELVPEVNIFVTGFVCIAKPSGRPKKKNAAASHRKEHA